MKNIETKNRNSKSNKDNNNKNNLDYNQSYSFVKIKVHNALFAGDRVEFIQPKGDNIFCKIKNIYDDKTLEKIKSAHGGQEKMAYIEIGKMPEVFSVMRKKLNC